jgi:hypothetical protein
MKRLSCGAVQEAAMDGGVAMGCGPGASGLGSVWAIGSGVGGSGGAARAGAGEAGAAGAGATRPWAPNGTVGPTLGASPSESVLWRWTSADGASGAADGRPCPPGRCDRPPWWRRLIGRIGVVRPVESEQRLSAASRSNSS